MLKEKLLEDLKSAMKEKNTNKKNAVQMVRTAILQIEKDKGIEVSDEQIIDIIAKEVKKRKDSLSDFEKANRQDLIDQINEEINVLEEYLPEQLSDEELEKIISKIVVDVEASSIKDMGKVMKEAKIEIGAKADGKRINEMVKKILDKYKDDFFNSIREPIIIHYTGKTKPWNTSNQSAQGVFADVFWKYARKTSFYEEILLAAVAAICKSQNKTVTNAANSRKKITLPQMLFSVKNEKYKGNKHKVLTFMGIKIKLKTKV